ncbi:MAG: NAD(P)-dependent oxidoreductase [Leptolinea sp.]|jgi:dTDP-4-dehydrorhamnose reductase|nr:NAD(P)-dependent oxidoreductase [Leptolinea sp.]
MKIAVTGAQGLLGEECMRTLGAEYDMLPLPSHRELDLVDFNATRDWFLAHKPDVIIHTAANRDPDSCERDHDLAWVSNVLVTYNVVNAARELDAVFVHASSDAVFPGNRDEPYHEFDEARDPINLYGYTKLASEKLVLQYLPKHFNLRLPLLFGRTGGLTRNNLLKARHAALSGQKTVAAGDTFSTACSVRDVARSLAVMLKTPFYGTYHFANSGEVSRSGYLQTFLKAIGLDPGWITASTIAEMKRPARRCHHIAITSLLLKPVFGITLQPVEDALAETVADMKADGIL